MKAIFFSLVLPIIFALTFFAVVLATAIIKTPKCDVCESSDVCYRDDSTGNYFCPSCLDSGADQIPLEDAIEEWENFLVEEEYRQEATTETDKWGYMDSSRFNYPKTTRATIQD